MSASQRNRVLAAARKAGPWGICGVDFLLPDVIDGGAPITRLPARIGELEKLGCVFKHGGRRMKTRVYVLSHVPTHLIDGLLPAPPENPPALFRDSPRLAIYDDQEAA